MAVDADRWNAFVAAVAQAQAAAACCLARAASAEVRTLCRLFGPQWKAHSEALGLRPASNGWLAACKALLARCRSRDDFELLHEWEQREHAALRQGQALLEATLDAPARAAVDACLTHGRSRAEHVRAARLRLLALTLVTPLPRASAPHAAPAARGPVRYRRTQGAKA